MRGRWRIYPIVVVSSLMLAACGGGGGGSSSDPDDNNDGGGGTAPQTLQFIESPSGLLSHNPASPGSTTVIDADADFTNVNSIPVLGATWNNGQTDAAYVERVVYQDSNGNLQQVSTDGSGGVTPTPQQISENTAAACQFNVAMDIADSTNSRVAYKRCDTGEWWYTWIDAAPTDKPVPFDGTPLVDLVAMSDGSHDGWLTLESGEIKRIAPGGALETIPGSPTGISAALHLESIQNASVLLNIDGDLWEYNPASGLTDLTYSFVNNTCFTGPATCPKLYVVDASEFYFIDNDKLFGTDLAADQVNELDQAVDVPSLALGGQRLAVNPNRVVWSYMTDPTPGDPFNGDEETVLRSIDKSTGTGSELRRVPYLAAGPSAQNQPFFDRTGDWFFYTWTDTIGGAPNAVAERMDGSDRQEYTDAAWQGGSINLVSFTNLNASVNHVFLVDGVTVAGDYANKNLKSVTGSAPGTTTNLGTTLSDTQGLLLIGGFGSDRLAGVTAGDGAGGTQQDILYLDAETAGSLQRITNTNNEDETPSPFF